MTGRLIAIAALWAAVCGPAFAVFSIAPTDPTLPEPATAALLGAGALAIAGARYLSKRRRGK